MNPRVTCCLNWKWSLPGIIVVALLSAFFNPQEPGVISGEFEFVQRVVDGDTLLLGTGEHVRLIGVNTPETSKKAVEAFGKEASAFTKRIVEGKLVRLESDPLASRNGDGKDRHSRTLAYVFLQDGTHLNAEIIRQGYGFAVSGSPPLKYQEEFRRLERKAREQRRGLWAVNPTTANIQSWSILTNTQPMKRFDRHSVNSGGSM